MSSELMSAARFGEGAPESTACPRVALLVGTPSTMMRGWACPESLRTANLDGGRGSRVAARLIGENAGNLAGQGLHHVRLIGPLYGRSTHCRAGGAQPLRDALQTGTRHHDFFEVQRVGRELEVSLDRRAGSERNGGRLCTVTDGARADRDLLALCARGGTTSRKFPLSFTYTTMFIEGIVTLA